MRWYNSHVSRLGFAVCGLVVAVLIVPAAALAYSWPLRPFYEPHPIRGYFNDPRLSGPETGFHFGVDIVADDMTPVYAIEPGRAVVFSDLATSYRIAGYAPVYVAAAPPAHVADTKENRPYQRRLDAIKFFRTGNLAIPRRYGAEWIVVARRRFELKLKLPRAYEDSRFVLYRLA